ncbi:MAG: hypothetical protein WDZ83_20235 [Rhizobiaceae bacterium]
MKLIKADAPYPDLGRRAALTGMGAVAAAAILLVPGLPSRVFAGPSPTADDLDVVVVGNYLAASAVLLGVPVGALAPQAEQDDIPLQFMYYTMCNGANSSATLAFTNTYVEYRDMGLSDQEIAARLLTFAAGPPAAVRSDGVGAMARLTMQMWLFGVWYGGTEVGNVTPSNKWITGEWAVDMVVSARAYKSSWIWRMAQAHPMGFSHFNFGSWADQPPSLSDYGIA